MTHTESIAPFKVYMYDYRSVQCSITLSDDNNNRNHSWMAKCHLLNTLLNTYHGLSHLILKFLVVLILQMGLREINDLAQCYTASTKQKLHLEPSWCGSD